MTSTLGTNEPKDAAVDAYLEIVQLTALGGDQCLCDLLVLLTLDE